MNKTLLAVLVAGACAAPSLVMAEDAPASPHTFTANVGVVSDYLFRGISQTHGAPALQGGVDYAHASGLYAGAWGSTIKWVEYAQDRNVPVELDLYGGYKNTIGSSDWNYDIGLITYIYPGSKSRPANASAKANTTEVYAALGWKFLTAKYSEVVSKNFVGWYGGSAGGDTGVGGNRLTNTEGSYYLELNANYDIGNGWGVNGHIGDQTVKGYQASGNTDASYMDWKVGVTKDVGFGVVGLAYSETDSKGVCAPGSTNTNAYCWYKYDAASNGQAGHRNESKGQFVLSFNKSF